MRDSRPLASADLARECHVFCRYLVGGPPSAYVLAQYRAGHRSPGFASGADTGPFDLLLIRIAGQGRVPARLLDAYSRLLRPRSLLRWKLVLLLAILECCPETHAALDSPDRVSAARLALRLLLQLAGVGLGLALAVPFLLPLQLALGRVRRPLEVSGRPAALGADRI